MKFTVLIPITGRAGKGKKDLPGSVIDLNPDHKDTQDWLAVNVIKPVEAVPPPAEQAPPPEKSAREIELEVLPYADLQAVARDLEITSLNRKAPRLIRAILDKEAELAA